LESQLASLAQLGLSLSILSSKSRYSPSEARDNIRGIWSTHMAKVMSLRQRIRRIPHYKEKQSED